MVFPHLLALIDDELERLRQARALLASLAPDDELLSEPTLPPQAAGVATLESDVPKEVLKVEAPAAQTAPAARPVYPVARRAPRQRVKPQPPAPERALGRPAPTGPVFVAATAAGRRPSDASRQPETGDGAARPAGDERPSGEGLTAEMLARRWLQPPTMS